MPDDQPKAPIGGGIRTEEPSRRGLLAELIRLCVPLLVGLGLAFAIHHFIVLPQLGLPADVRRPIAIASSLDADLFKDDDSVAVIISNSAGVEGIDASIVQAAAPEGWRVYNFSTNGTNQVEARLLADRLADAGADLVIWLFRPDMLSTPRSMHPDVVFAYALGKFADTTPWIGGPWVDAETLTQLDAGQSAMSAHFRRRWLDALNYSMRRRMRSGIRTPESDNFQSPFNLEVVLDGERLDRHVGEIAAMMDAELTGIEANGPTSGREFMREMIDDFMHRPAELAIVIAPTHPDLDEQFKPIEIEVLSFFKPFSASKGLRVGTAAGLLEVSDYADAIHPNESGRVRLSTWLGEWMPPPPSEQSDLR
ncbi:MAG: hypothetical protein CMJ54_09595 [Planctomycetaceae bacterium]|nr:hypothetical protein [Planctomycetaceae bacterium]